MLQTTQLVFYSMKAMDSSGCFVRIPCLFATLVVYQEGVGVCCYPTQTRVVRESMQARAISSSDGCYGQFPAIFLDRLGDARGSRLTID